MKKDWKWRNVSKLSSILRENDKNTVAFLFQVSFPSRRERESERGKKKNKKKSKNTQLEENLSTAGKNNNNNDN